MRPLGDVPIDVRRLQSEVSDPDVSAWVAANAGSGKTHVLAQRVINLLLGGVEPEKILCITFTKAAAANMAKRVFDTLAAWALLDDAALDAAIRGQSRMTPDAERRTAARRLFARALETPGGLKVQTIHAFCAQLLHQFPFEANVAARFGVLDEAERNQLLEQVTLGVLLDGSAAPESRLGRALAGAMIAAADVTFREVVREAIGRRDAIDGWVGETGDLDAAIAALSRALGVDPADNRDRIDAEFFADASIAPEEWPLLAAALAAGGKSDAEQARRFAALESLSGPDRVEAYLEIFCTGEGTPRKSIVTKAIKNADLVERLGAEQERICALLARRRAVSCRDRSAALVTVAHEVLTRYWRDKERNGLLDYDDLIDRTLALLRSVEAAWVHYKLDLGIDHLLIDEAQDTSSKQWEIVRLLVAEFTAGAGARSGRRTLFAVGDEKQSIYSFQHAAPQDFDEMRRYFKKAHDDAGLAFIYKKLEHSFRSGETLLAAVDEVFKSELVAASVTSDKAGVPPHIALPNAPPSLVEIWEPIEPEQRRDIEGWDAPFDRIGETSPRVKLAQRIARTVRRLIDRREAVGGERRAVRYGDILVLVRQRGPLFEAIIRALKNQNVVVAGADRLVLTEHIAVMDLMTLADALLLPEDDLALATVLRSPLFGFSDEDLFAIAWDRGDASLRSALRKHSGEKFAAASALLDGLSQLAGRESPFGFFADILGAGGGRRRILSRLGPEANDALDEFLNLAFEYERRQTPSLRGFVAWLREARAEVKRDMEIARDEVRVMTVHGAKGLEAPVVILADTMTPPKGPRPPRLLAMPQGPLLWAGRKADDVTPVAAARQAAERGAEDEYRRLLYVAMTRAADRLIVCGAEGMNGRPAGCWYDLIRTPLEPFLVEDEQDGEKVLRYRKTDADFAAEFAAPVASPAPPATADHHAPPAWLRHLARSQQTATLTLSPSSAFEAEISAAAIGGGGGVPDRRKARQRGILVHRLMQSLPDIPPAARSDAAARYLDRATDFAAAERAEIAAKVLAILDDESFAGIFAPGSRAEVPIVGRILGDDGRPIEITGQVDRLAIDADAVLIADYKSDRAVPRDLNDVEAYVAQLALYRAVLSRLYPAKTVRAALLFTEGPALMEVSEAAMDAAFAKVLAKACHAKVRSLDAPGDGS